MDAERWVVPTPPSSWRGFVNAQLYHISTCIMSAFLSGALAARRFTLGVARDLPTLPEGDDAGRAKLRGLRALPPARA